MTVCALEISMLFPSLPALMRDFGDPATVMWTVTIHYLAAASSVALAGRLGDLFGRKRILLAALCIALCGSLLSLESSSLLEIIVGRGLQGLSAAVIPLSFGLVREIMPHERVPFGIGVVATAAPVVGGVGTLIGGVLVDTLSWRWIFGTSAAVTACTILLAWGRSRPPRVSPIRRRRSTWSAGCCCLPQSRRYCLPCITLGNGAGSMRALLGCWRRG